MPTKKISESQKSSGKKNASAKKGARKASRETAAAAEVRLRSPTRRQVSVALLAAAPKFERPKRIHPRRRLPYVTEGNEVAIPSPTPQLNFELPLAAHALAAAAVTDNIALAKNTELTSPGTNNTASIVGEPSLASNGNVVMYAGNWYAAISSDGGDTFQFLDPAEVFREFDPPGLSFCCDQVVHYIRQIDTFVWLLQYGNSNPNQPDGDNIQRLAIARTADVAAGRWRLFDITTATFGTPGAFLDFPDLAVGANALYVTTNVFPQDPNSPAVGAVLRIPFAGLVSGNVTARPFVAPEDFSLRVAQNCGTRVFFAAHRDTSTLNVYSWRESDAAPSAPRPVSVARWEGLDGYVSRTPDGRRWLDRADPRITGATKVGNELWFAWGVDKGGANNRPHPFVQLARINSTNMTLIENVNIWSQDFAACYAALATNSNNEVGVSYMIGGGNKFPSHVVGMLTGARKDLIVAEGTRSPAPDPRTGKFEWGDYLSVRRHFPRQKLFAASGFTLQSGGTDSGRDTTPRFVLFGRAGDV